MATGENGNISQTSIDAGFIKARWNAEHFTTTAIIFLAKIQVNCHFFTEVVIENDIDPSQIKSMDDHCKVMDYMKAISKLLQKEVILTEENVEDAIWVRVNGDIIEFIQEN